MAENFDLIFGQNASQQYAWSDNDYQNGWETIGSIPPTAAQFDALQRRADTKAQELNNNLAPLVAQNTANNRQPLTTYSLKDIRYSPLLPTGWFLECAVDGTTDSGEITVPSPLVENATITDGTVTWKIRKISSADGMPIGAIIAFGGNGDIPSGYLLCDGAAYSRTAFPDLFAAIGTDYGSGDGSTTFNVPDSNQAKRFLQGDTTAGTVKAAGLPNIKGSTDWWTYGHGGANASGAFYNALPADANIYAPLASGTAAGNQLLSFDASKVNPIYSDSVSTVQPDALTTRFIIKAFDGQTADSALIDITQFENELGGKADRSLSNLTDAGKSFSFPSDTYLNVTNQLTNNSYTAPADGYFFVTAKTTASTGAELSVASTANEFGTTDSVSALNYFIKAITILKKGHTAQVAYSNCTITKAYFIYAAGEIPV